MAGIEQEIFPNKKLEKPASKRLLNISLFPISLFIGYVYSYLMKVPLFLELQ